MPAPSVNRNGNLQLAQDYYVAAQPSSAAAQAAQALFYAGAENIGGQASDPNLLTDGNITWTPSGWASPITSPAMTAAASSPPPPAPPSTSRAAAPSTSTGPPARAAPIPISSMVNGVGRTFGLLQASNGDPTPDPQWPYLAGTRTSSSTRSTARTRSSAPSTGNIFDTTNQGKTWFDIGTPATFGCRRPPADATQLRPGLRRPRSYAPRRASATWATSSTSAPRR